MQRHVLYRNYYPSVGIVTVRIQWKSAADVCENEASHPEAPHHVCTSCHFRVWDHLKRVRARSLMIKAFGYVKNAWQH